VQFVHGGAKLRERLLGRTPHRHRGTCVQNSNASDTIKLFAHIP
jgi:hypothetical protein